MNDRTRVPLLELLEMWEEVSARIDSLGSETALKLLELINSHLRHQRFTTFEKDVMRYVFVLEGRRQGKTWLEAYHYASEALANEPGRGRGSVDTMASSYKKIRRLRLG